MKFGDKLISLRKKHGLSQEELAAKLNVSRQSVSKWESNDTYPETEKIIKICNIFDCSMDDLINENIKDLSNIERKDKNNWNIIVDSLLDFITKSIDMFASMNFISGLKCIIELLIVIGILSLSGYIVIEVITSIMCNLFSFISYDILRVIRSILEGIGSIIWLILSIIVIIHVFKIRYLDYYNKSIKEENNDNNSRSENKIKKEEQKKISINHKPKIIIRDSKHEPFAFLSILSRIIIWFIKFIAIWIVFGFIISLLCFIICLVVFISLSIHSLIFIGGSICLIGVIIINIIIIITLLNFITNRKNHFKIMLIIFISSIVLAGIGTGIGLISLKDIEVKDTYEIANKDVYEEKIKYNENILITNNQNDIEYIIDNSISSDEIVISTKYDKRLSTIKLHQYDLYGMNTYSLYSETKVNFKDTYDIVIKDLKNNIIRNYSYNDLNNIQIKSSTNTINKLINNLSKVYLFDKEEKTNGYKITNITDKIDVIYHNCGGEYNALSDNIEIDSPYCKCERKVVETSYGEKIKYNCYYEEEK